MSVYFNPKELGAYYSNLQLVMQSGCYYYAVLDAYGNQTGSISYTDDGEWFFELDNYPAQKKELKRCRQFLDWRHFEEVVVGFGLSLVVRNPLKPSSR